MTDDVIIAPPPKPIKTSGKFKNTDEISNFLSKNMNVFFSELYRHIYFIWKRTGGYTSDVQPIITPGTTAQYFRGDKTWHTLNTSVVPENSNLYYTDVRARASINNSAPITYNSSTGTIGITQANSTTDGYLSKEDWNTFNNKLSIAEFNTAMKLNPQTSIPSNPTDGTIYVGGTLGDMHLYIYLNGAWHTLI